ncbi:MAG: 50S ribosomal protein L6 [Clostridia bacterium]|nr:50S ribosomal protein L6 [Clostridia bacterium]
MSRIGKMPITVPAGVEVNIAEGNVVTVKSSKATMTQKFNPGMIIKQDGNTITVERPNDEHQYKSLHGLTRTLLSNMIHGLDKGFSKELEVNGVGYKAALEGKKLVLNVGYSHPVTMEAPEGIEIEVPAPNKIIIKGYNKQVVGQFASEVRGKRPPEPYKGKGIKYATETIRRKEGKAGGKK